MSTWHDLVGLPHVTLDKRRGLTCWDLAREVLRRRGIHLPARALDWFGTIVAPQLRDLLVAGEPAADVDWLRVENPQQDDLILFREGRFFNHVGVMVEADLVLHVAEQHHATTERLSRTWRRWIAYRPMPRSAPCS